MERASSATFREAYSAMTDAELLSIAADRETLVDEAKLALDDELRRRQLGEADLLQHRAHLDSIRRHDERERKLRTLRRRRWIQDWFTDPPLVLGLVAAWAARYVALHVFSASRFTANVVAGAIALATMIISAIAGLVILGKRSKWRKRSSGSM
jgi:hypothetical protein